MSDHDDFTRAVTRRLDASVDGLDAATRSRLAQARHAALASRRRPVRTWLWGGLAATMAGGFAIAFALGLHLRVAPPTPAPSSELAATLDDDFAEDVRADLYTDLDFYAWLSDQDAVASNPAGHL